MEAQYDFYKSYIPHHLRIFCAFAGLGRLCFAQGLNQHTKKRFFCVRDDEMFCINTIVLRAAITKAQ